MSRALGVLVLVLTLGLVVAGCGSGSGQGGEAQGGNAGSAPTCKSLVDKPLAKAWDSSAKEPTCVDSGGQVPFAWQSSGCYPGGKYDKQTPMISFSADDGFYFGRTGEQLRFKAGTPSMSEMSKIVGC